MFLYIGLLLIQLSLVLGAPSNKGPADTPACARCHWDPVIVSDHEDKEDGYSYNENLKITKKPDGCIQAEFTCQENGIGRFVTQDGENFNYFELSPFFYFKEKFNTTLTCDGKSPYWKLHKVHPLQPLPTLHEPGVIRALFCMTKIKTQ